MNGPRFPDGPAVLLCDGRPVAPLEILASRRARYRGLLGRDALDGAVLLLHTNGVHTFGMRFPIDVAYLSKRFKVVDIVRMPPTRLGRNRLTARHTLEAQAGALTSWEVTVGASLAVEPVPPA